jgi:hypothetical protein
VTVNYGSPVEFVTKDFTYKEIEWSSTRARHVAENGHEQLKDGEQCECGQLKVGIR